MILNISLHTFDKKKIKEDAKKFSESYHIIQIIRQIINFMTTYWLKKFFLIIHN